MPSKRSKRGLRAHFSSKKSAKWFQNRVVPVGGGEPLFTHQINQDTQVSFCTNHIKSSKYTIYTFFFLNLFEQFRRVANFYFLLVAVIQLALPSSPVSPGTSVMPLIFVVFVTMLKQGYEDYCRHKSDRELNMAKVTLLRNGQFVTACSQDIKVGDIVMVRDKENFPADLVVISSSAVNGKCFVMTANLDGETNLKPMAAARLTKHCQSPEELTNISGQIECENPSPDLHNFLGRMKLKNRDEMALCSLSLENLVMRGTQLRNTEHVYGCAVYTGRDTKLSQNSKSTANKFSTVEITMNKYLLIFMAILIFEILVSTSLRFTWGIDVPGSHYEDEFHWYLGGDVVVEASVVIQDLFSFLVLYNYIIPISLYVTLEVQKFLGSKFLVWDLDLYDKETDEPAKCNSSDLNEELGQIEILFSDKTGTLTENIMIFKEASIVGRQYRGEELIAKNHHPYSSFSNDERVREDSMLEESFSDPQDELHIVDFLSAIAICHTVQTAKKSKASPAAPRKSKSNGLKLPTANGLRHANGGVKKGLNGLMKRKVGGGGVGQEDGVVSSCGEGSISSIGSSSKTGIMNSGYNSSVAEGLDEFSVCSDTSQIEYNASSPDEKALVEACLKYGVAYLGDDESGPEVQIKILDSRSGSPVVRTYTRLYVLEFDSTRKRMSVIVRSSCGEIKLITKGAESSVLPRCIAGPIFETNKHIDEYALVGLRTLAFGVRVFTDEEFAKFERDLFEAQQALEGREGRIQNIFDETERDLTLIGATAVEDKLQFGVRDTLVNLGLAGISVWILTGDKKETAINISYACGHLLPTLTVLDLTGLLSTTITGRMERYVEQMRNSGDKFGLVVDGAAIALIMPVEENKRLLFEVSSKCQAVVCCRMSPLQKSEIVKMIKTSPHKPITAAIGDGGNDVAMIQEAHVGLGIMGKEGRAAVRAADFAFSKFHYLQKVLLVHGHWYYYRVALLVQYFFYKNVACFTCQQYYAFFNSFSGQTLFDTMGLTLYNISYTSIPILVFSLMEQNLKKSNLSSNPALYNRNYRNKLLSWKEFFAWLFQAFWHSIVLFFGWYIFFTYRPNAGGLSMTTTSRHNLDQASFGLCIYSTVIALVNIRLLYQSRCWNAPLLIVAVLSVLVYMGVTLFVSSVPISFFGTQSYWAYNHTLSSPGVWLYTLLVLVVALIPDVVLRTFRKHWLNIKLGVRETRDELDDRMNRGNYELNSVYTYDNKTFNDQVIFRAANRNKDNPGMC